MNLLSLWNWLVTSSADPKQTSLAVKGALMLGGSYLLHSIALVCGLGLVCITGVDQTWINQAVDMTAKVVDGCLILVGAFASVAGLGCKVSFGRWSAHQEPSRVRRSTPV